MIALGGELDLAVVEELERRLFALVDGGRHDLLIDLSEVSLIDAGTLGVLVRLLQRCRAEGGEVRLGNVQPLVRRVLEVTELGRLFPVEGSARSARSPRSGRGRR